MELRISAEVSKALKDGAPVVALESTVIAHGLPRPLNLETALECEEVVRKNGGVPATIAILDGVPTIGLSHDSLRFIAEAEHIRKISRRDIPIAIAKGLNCATTVSTTMFFAHRAGIKVFATGGIGGVHRGHASDVSADLPELAATPMTVVCSGAKAILDLAATREWLETHGVTILGWKCDEMPAFYSSRSGLDVDERVDAFEEVALVVKARDSQSIRGTVLVTVPVPKGDEVDSREVEKILSDSLRLAEDHHIFGKELTPFLLSEMSRISQGQTLTANTALLINNAKIATGIAVALAG
jgi:pseudouridine-5'-phosphate glycosidase